jgi:hypothetical protein
MMNYKSAINKGMALLTAGTVATSCGPSPEQDVFHTTYDKAPKGMSADGYASRLLREGQKLEGQGIYFSEIADWKHAAPKLKDALGKYTELISRFPNSSYAHKAQKALSDFYTDPVLQESENGDTIPMGNGTLIITSIQKIEPFEGNQTDCVVGYKAYGTDGRRIDVQPKNPFTKNGKVDLRFHDYTPSELLGK